MLQCGILQIHSNILKISSNYCANNLPEPVTKKKEYVTYQTLLKRCENAMAKHIFQYTINLQKMSWIYV